MCTNRLVDLTITDSNFWKKYDISLFQFVQNSLIINNLPEFKYYLKMFS